MNNKASLFLVFVEQEFQGFMVVEIVPNAFKAYQTLCVWLMDFRGAEEHFDLLDRHVTNLAVLGNCSKVHVRSPRLGWKKHADKYGYKLKIITWERHVQL